MSIQFLRRKVLGDVTRIGVENEEQRVLVEVGDLGLDGSYVLDVVAFRQPEMGNRWPRRLVVI